ncbi:glycosyltransferase family A protein [Salmonirosea aquatica]|uniref:glycosyltransferase family A protein n=1 Tax=Salmonirosea aquatica TaxID=2654236 RepID=UPI0035711099
MITHFNRSYSLERLLNSFRELNCTFHRIVVSDDGSVGKHRERLPALQAEYQFELLLAAVNSGLGHNINKGQDAVQTEYTLYVQEDFEPTPLFPVKLGEALAFMRADPTLDMVRFYAFLDYPIKVPFGQGFSELKFNWRHPSHIKFYAYSDHPHLRRSDFLTKFGRYLEGESGDRTEFDTALRFLRGGGRALFYNEYSSLFYHRNSPHEPSTMGRSSWKESNHWAVELSRALYLRYRWLKNSLQLLLLRSEN